ncbi:MAG: tRNA pseudouridine(55) synthase TruB [Acetatifactor sp.]
MNGIMIVNKESGFTSHDVVAKLRGICGQRKIGHTGTLDPAATGVLPVCLGNATKLCDMLTDKKKEYVTELLLGVETDTQDTTGVILSERQVTADEEEVRRVCGSFLGDYNQVPPMYSALKVNGKKLYELAREGREVERKPRPVTIYELEILAVELPVVKMRVLCSKGTYIRTLCADIGAALGCGGTMQSLQRTAVGPFRLEEARTLGELQQLKDKNRLMEAVMPVDSVFPDCPSLHVTGEGDRLLSNGNVLAIGLTEEKRVYEPGVPVKLYGLCGNFAGIYTYDGEKQYYKPVKMFLERE